MSVTCRLGIHTLQLIRILHDMLFFTHKRPVSFLALDCPFRIARQATSGSHDGRSSIAMSRTRSSFEASTQPRIYVCDNPGKLALQSKASRMIARCAGLLDRPFGFQVADMIIINLRGSPHTFVKSCQRCPSMRQPFLAVLCLPRCSYKYRLKHCMVVDLFLCYTFAKQSRAPPNWNLE